MNPCLVTVAAGVQCSPGLVEHTSGFYHSRGGADLGVCLVPPSPLKHCSLALPLGRYELGTLALCTLLP